MLSLPDLPDVWRVLKEADLNKLRREAERPFQVVLVAEDVRDAERLGVLLSGPEATRHPWLLPADPAEARRAAGSTPLDLAVALSPTPDPSPALAFAVDALRETIGNEATMEEPKTLRHARGGGRSLPFPEETS